MAVIPYSITYQKINNAIENKETINEESEEDD